MATYNNRLFYGVEAVGIAPLGSNTYTAVHGVQSASIATKFDIQQAYELGQINVYQNIEYIPDIEVSLEKCLDGYPLIYHLMTYGASDATLVGRSTKRGTLAFNVYGETQLSASGVQTSQCVCSGLYVNQIGFNIEVGGSAKETSTLVGNNKAFLTSSFTYSPTFTNADVPQASEGVNQRQHFLMASGLYPNTIYGISGNTNPFQNGGVVYSAHLQSFRISANLGRTPLLELGSKLAYFRYVEFPVEVRTDIEVIATEQDRVQALETATNTSDEPIKIQMLEGTKIDCGSANRLINVQFSAGGAGARGGNATITYNYQNFNTMTVRHSNDPTTALAA